MVATWRASKSIEDELLSLSKTWKVLSQSIFVRLILSLNRNRWSYVLNFLILLFSKEENAMNITTVVPMNDHGVNPETLST